MHILIIGMTRSGKTEYARRLARAIRGKGKPVIVLDGKVDPALRGGPNLNGWPADFVTGDFDEFERVFWANRDCFSIVDESPDLFEARRSEARQLFRRGSQQCHVCAFIATRWAGVDKTIRDSCVEVVAFTMQPDDAEYVANSFNNPALKQIAHMPPLNYIRVRLHEPARKGVLTF